VSAEQRLTYRELFYLARYHPEALMEYRAEEAVISRQQEMRYAQTRQQAEQAYVEQLRQLDKIRQEPILKSEQFYKELGYPEYAGKYEPFDIPAGYVVGEIKETLVTPAFLKGALVGVGVTEVTPIKQLEVTFKPTLETEARALGYELGETVYVQRMLSYSALGGLTMVTPMTVEQALKEGIPLTPKGQPTPIEMHYATAATILGMQAVLAPSIAKIETAIMGKIQAKAQTWLTAKYVEKGPLEWAGLKEKAVMRLTGARPYLAPGEVSIPIVEVVGPKGIEAVPKGLPYTAYGWELAISPKTAALMIPKFPTEPLAQALPKLLGVLTTSELEGFLKYYAREEPMPLEYLKAFKKEPVPAQPLEKGLPPSMLETGYYPALGFERKIPEVSVKGLFAWRGWPTVRELMETQKLLPFVTQTQLTRMGIYPPAPYVGTLQTGVTSKAVAQILGVFAGVALFPKAVPRAKVELAPMVFQELLPKVKPKVFLEPFELVSLRLFPKVYPKERERGKIVPIIDPFVGVSPFEEVAPTLAVSPIQEIAQIQQQIARQIQIPKAVQITKVETIVQTAQIQQVAQVQKQLQKQVLLQRQLEMPRFTQRQVSSFLRDSFGVGPAFRRKAKEPLSLFGRYPRLYPLATPKQVMKMFARLK